MNSIATAISAIFAMGSAQDDGQLLTIDDAVMIGEKHAFSVLLQQIAVEKAANAKSEAETGLRPAVTGNVAATRNDREIASSFGGSSIVSSPLNSLSAGATVSVPVDIFGAIRRQIAAAKSNKEAAEFSLQGTINDIRLAIRTAYYDVLRAQSQVQVQAQSVSETKDRQRQTADRVAAGDAARVELTSIDAQVADAETNLIEANNRYALARQYLNQVLGRPIETDFTVKDVESRPAIPATAVNAIVQEAYGNRPDIKAFASTLEATRQRKRATEAALYPSLSFNVNANWQGYDSPSGNGSDSGGNAQALLSIPIFDRGTTRERAKQVQRDFESLQVQLDELKLAISAEVRSALTNLAGAEARVNSTTTQLASAEETYRIAVVRRDAGEGTYVEISDALTQLQVARTANVTARYDYLNAYAQLQRAIGRDEVTGDTPK